MTMTDREDMIAACFTISLFVSSAIMLIGVIFMWREEPPSSLWNIALVVASYLGGVAILFIFVCVMVYLIDTIMDWIERL